MAQSIRERVEKVLLAETRRRGTGVLLRQIAEAFRHRWSDVRDDRQISHALSVLCRAGVAVKIGGRVRYTQYAHASHPVPLAESADPGPQILEIVETLSRDTGEAVSAAQVHRVLTDEGEFDLSIDQVRTRLNSLAHGSAQKRDRGTAAWNRPRLKAIRRTSRGGRQQVLYAPMTGTYAAPPVMDYRDAARAAVLYAEEAVGLPVTKAEIRLWARVTGELLDAGGSAVAVARAVQDDRFSAVLSAVAHHDSDNGSTGISEVRTPLTSRGAYPCRYSARAADPATADAAVLLDVVALLRPSLELGSLNHLRRRAESNPVLTEIAQLREEALGLALQRALGWDDLGGQRLDRALNRICAAREQLRLMHARRPQSDGWRIGRDLDRLSRQEQDLAAVRQLGHLHQESTATEVTTIEVTTGVPFPSLENLAREVLGIVGSDAEHWRPVLETARRVTGPRAGGISAEDLSQIQSWVDRTDALLVLVEQCPLPRINALVRPAADLLGFVLRDTRRVADWLQRPEARDPVLRSRLVVAASLLGELAEADLAWPNPRDRDGAESYLAAVALAVDDQDERLSLMEAALRRAEGRALPVAEKALTRLQLGGRLSVID